MGTVEENLRKLEEIRKKNDKLDTRVLEAEIAVCEGRLVGTKNALRIMKRKR